MARKSNTDPNAPIPGERRGLRGGLSDTVQNQAIGDDESTRAEESLQPQELLGDSTQAEPGIFDVPTRGGGLLFERTPIEPMDVSDDEILEPSKVIPAPDIDDEPEEDMSEEGEPEDSASDDDEPIEHTTIDSGLLEKLRATEDLGDKTNALTPASAFDEVPTTLGNPEKSKSSAKPKNLKAPRPPESKNRPTNIDDVASATADLSDAPRVAPFEKMASGSVNASNPNDKPGSTMILEGGDHRKALEAAAAARAAKLGPIPEPIPVPTLDEPPSEQPTSARPLSSASYSGEGPREKSAGSSTGDFPKEDDGWSDYQESADDWGRSDSHSSVKQQKSDNNTNSGNRTPARGNDSSVFAKPERSEVKIVVKLLALEGEDTGEIDIAQEDVTFGREADCPIVLKDPSISRRHARLMRVENGWELTDLKSGNGTFVNGKRVERAIVRHNDEIKLGSALFRFVDPSEGMRPVDASAAPVLAASSRVALFARMRENPRLRTMVVASGALSVVLLLALTVLAYQRGGGGKAKTEVFQLYLQGVEQFKQHRWVPAEGFFAAALQRDHEHQRSRRYLEAIAVEKRADLALANAKARLGAGDLAGAYENAIQASDSVFFGADAQAIINTVDHDADERLAKAKSALAGDDKVAARNLLNGLEFYSAYRADLNELRRQAGLPAIAGKATNILTQYQEPTAGKAESVVPQRAAATPAPAPRSPTAEAADALADGRIDEATMKLKALGDNKEATEILDRIGKFNQLYTDGKSELALKRPDGAIRALTVAVATLEHVTGQRGDLDKRVRRELADALYLRAVNEFSTGKVDDAKETARLATSYSPNHENSVNLLTKIQMERH